MPKARLLPLTVLPLLLAGTLAGCATPDQKSSSPTTTPSSTAPHFTYSGEDGPTHWGDLSADWKTCSTGAEQSPIDLAATTDGTPDLEAAYPGQVAFEAVDNGHTVQVSPAGDASVTSGGTSYSLAQIHFHAPSEHEIDGKKADAEFHLVHSDADGQLLVVGVLAHAGAESTAWAPFDAAVQAAADDTHEGSSTSATTAGQIDLGALLPKDLDHYSYEGSLTTPPCTEGVQWRVLETPVELSSEQIARLRRAHDENARPIQPLNDRSVLSVD
jgi:carbonic anhydrase